MEIGGRSTEKKPLTVVGLGAVVLLVLTSFSNVVGFQSLKTHAVNDSPLFKTRTQRATNQQQITLNSQYLGKGNRNLLYFSMHNNRTESLKRVIDIISKMDDKTFSQLIGVCIQRAQQVNTFSDTNPNEIVQTLQLLGTHPTTIINHFIKRNNQNITLSNYYTICHWFPGCVVAIILYNLPDMIMLVLFFILSVIYEITFRYSIVITCQNSICIGARCSNTQNMQYSLEELS